MGFQYCRSAALGFSVLALLTLLLPLLLGLTHLLFFYVAMAQLLAALALLALAFLRGRKVRLQRAKAGAILTWPDKAADEADPIRPLLRLLPAVLFFTAAIALLFWRAYPALGLYAVCGAMVVFAFSCACVFYVGASVQQALFSQGFMLCHQALLYRGKLLLLNGKSKGVGRFQLQNDVLHFNLYIGNKTLPLQISVPPEQTERVEAFLEDLSRHFSKEEA